jgi:hypothetical protein
MPAPVLRDPRAVAAYLPSLALGATPFPGRLFDEARMRLVAHAHQRATVHLKHSVVKG